ncbi:cytochrome-c oxidase [Roseomonas terrae]|jgi:cytochrome c oxidase subunit 3|uniref:Cytochrome-c oxidase n=1 Tax=Neoroseomonas terrae TaxID=424799 RepID=A0ABS5EGT3_9PROT|nr:cytochrome c oxidase subunit 3 [Neoroseomonas terrae]MBR0650180.1 cytochrome-c oxidase [Neoroseomonas terrae]
MNAIILYLAVVGCIAGWWLSRQRLMSKPWLEVGVPAEVTRGEVPGVPPVKLGLWVFMAVVGALITLFISAYLMRMHMADDWRSIPTPSMLWFNTGLLMLSSFSLYRAELDARIGWREGIAVGLAAGGLSALAFLAGQYLAWQQVMAEGFGVATNPSSSFFYLITAVHGLHLIGGLIVLGRTAYRTARGSPLAQLRLSTELCATYWHFLLLVWFALFALLLHG